MDALATPHLSDVLRARDTTTGELLWSVDLDAPAAGLWWYGDRVLAVIPNEHGSSETAAVVVVDATTGEVVTTVPTTLDIAFVELSSSRPMAGPGRGAPSALAGRDVRHSAGTDCPVWARVDRDVADRAGQAAGARGGGPSARIRARARSASSAISSGVWLSPLSSSSRRSSSGSRLRRCSWAARRRCSGISSSATPAGATSTVEPSKWMLPSGRRHSMVRSARRVSVQPPSWTRWWWRLHSGSRLARSVEPPCCHGVDVVDVAVVEADGAAGVGAGAVHRPQRPALVSCRHPLGSPDVEGDTVAVEHDRDDVGVAAQPADRGHGHGLTGRRLAHRAVVQPVSQRVEVDQHRHLGHAAAGTAGAGDQPDEGVGLDLVERAVVGAVGLLGADRRAERVGDGGVGQRVQHEVGVAQPGDPVDPAAHAALPAQVLVAAHPVVARQDLAELAHLTGERLDRRRLGRLDERRLQLLEIAATAIVEVLDHTGPARRHGPADTCRRPARRAPRATGRTPRRVAPPARHPWPPGGRRRRAVTTAPHTHPASASRRACDGDAHVEGVEPAHGPAATSATRSARPLRSHVAGSAAASCVTSATTRATTHVSMIANIRSRVKKKSRSAAVASAANGADGHRSGRAASRGHRRSTRSAAQGSSSGCRRRFRDEPALLGLAVIVLVWFVVFERLVWNRHAAFATFDFDLGHHDQAIWLLSRGKGFITVSGMPVLGHHFTVAYFALAPLYWLGGGPQLLIVLQNAALALAAVPIYLLARDRLQQRVVGAGPRRGVAAQPVGAVAGVGDVAPRDDGHPVLPRRLPDGVAAAVDARTGCCSSPRWRGRRTSPSPSACSASSWPSAASGASGC